jgi:hypothetical protein
VALGPPQRSLLKWARALLGAYFLTWRSADRLGLDLEVSEAQRLAERLVELALGPDPSVSLQAIKLIHERLYGRPGQHVTASDSDPLADVDMSPDEAREILRQPHELRDLPEADD